MRAVKPAGPPKRPGTLPCVDLIISTNKACTSSSDIRTPGISMSYATVKRV